MELKCPGELLSAFHTLILGKWVTSSPLLDPVGCLGSEAKTNQDLRKRSVPATYRAGGGRVSGSLLHTDIGLACGIPFRHLQSLCQAHLFWISQP